MGCLEHYIEVGGVSSAVHGGGWCALSITWGWVVCLERYMGVGGVS